MPYKSKKMNKKSKDSNYLKLFLTTFFGLLIFFIVIAVHLFSNVDTAIGENDQGDIKENGLGVKHLIDSRLKFIQMEDNNTLPSTQVLDSNENNDNSAEVELAEVVLQPIPEKNEPSQNYGSDNTFNRTNSFENNNLVKFPSAPVPKVEPAISPTTVYKVYIGTYSTMEQARIAQNIVDDSSIGVPSFVKTLTEDAYTIQVGSFADYTKALELTNQLKNSHFPARLVKE